MALFVVLFMEVLPFCLEIWAFLHVCCRAVVVAVMAFFAWPLRMSLAWAKGYLGHTY